MNYIVKCAFCKKLFQSTKGETEEEQFISLMVNIDNHVKRSHREEWEENNGIRLSLVAGIGLMQWRDFVEFVEKTEGGVKAKEAIEEKIGQAECLFGEYFEDDDGDDDGEFEDEDLVTADQQEQEGQEEEGVIELTNSIEPIKEPVEQSV